MSSTSNFAMNNKPIKYVNLQNQKVPENIIRIIMKSDGLLEKQINAFFKPPDDILPSSTTNTATDLATPTFSMSDQIKAAKLAKQQRALQPMVNNNNNNNSNSVQTTFSDNINSAKTIESVKTGLLLSPVTMAMVEKVKAKPSTATPVLPASERTRQMQPANSSSSPASPTLPAKVLAVDGSTKINNSNKNDVVDDEEAEWEDSENPKIIAMRKKEAEKKKLEKLRNGKTVTSASSVPMIPLPQSAASTVIASTKPPSKYKFKSATTVTPQSKLVQAQVQQALSSSHALPQPSSSSSSSSSPIVVPAVTVAVTLLPSSSVSSKVHHIQSSTSSSSSSSSSLTAATSDTTALTASTMSNSSSSSSIASDDDFLNISQSAVITVTPSTSKTIVNTSTVSSPPLKPVVVVAAKPLKVNQVSVGDNHHDDNDNEEDDDEDIDDNDTFDVNTTPYLHPIVPTAIVPLTNPITPTPPSVATTANASATTAPVITASHASVSNVLKSYSPRISSSPSSSSSSLLLSTNNNSMSNKSHHPSHRLNRSRNSSNGSTDDPAPWRKNNTDDNSHLADSSSLGNRNAAFFAGLREMRIQEQREKEELEASMDENQLSLLKQQEKERLQHNSQKSSHYAQLGLAFAKSPLISLMSHTHGNSLSSRSCSSQRDSNKSNGSSFRYSPRNTMSARVSGNVLGRTSMFQGVSSKAFDSNSNKSMTDEIITNNSGKSLSRGSGSGSESNHGNKTTTATTAANRSAHMMKKMMSLDHFDTHHHQLQSQQSSSSSADVSRRNPPPTTLWQSLMSL